MKVLILGVTGMLGNAMFRYFSERDDWAVYGTARGHRAFQYFSDSLSGRIISGIDVENMDTLIKAFATVQPDVVVNCVGLVKQLANANDPIQAIPMNSLLPHRLASICKATGARLVHISTDCVFSGSQGGYIETDFPDAYDIYGRSKLLGEVDYPHAITLRTSIIGHELGGGGRSLVNWFLAQSGLVKGYKRAVFSGLPTVELAHVVRDVVLLNKEMHGLYHVSATPISKFDLLELIAKTYGKQVAIEASELPVIDRSLNSDRFKDATGYAAPGWEALIQRMYEFK